MLPVLLALALQAGPAPPGEGAPSSPPPGEGPLILERGPAETPLFHAWLDSGPHAGFRRSDEVNGERQEGFNA